VRQLMISSVHQLMFSIQPFVVSSKMSENDGLNLLVWSNDQPKNQNIFNVHSYVIHSSTTLLGTPVQLLVNANS
ncbi:hypothetical protein P3381_23965, partial [Vibrio parahaemolyticus]|nr:hypothetical protein [Vibrio parahaemolyticus]